MTLCRTLLVVAAFLILSSWACPPEQMHNGCKIVAGTCQCGHGCKTEYIYKYRRLCNNALKGKRAPPEHSTNSCSNLPCSRGICIQTTSGMGFTCKCEGTGFYGQRCERACPSIPEFGGPHECVVI